MAERVWNIEADNRSPTTWRWVAAEFERRLDKHGHGYWQRVRYLGKVRPAKWSAVADGEESGLPRDETAQHKRKAWRLNDYVNEETEASARLGGCGLALVGRSNKATWSLAIAHRESPGHAWHVVAHLGTRRCRPADVAHSFGLPLVLVAKLPKTPGERAWTQEEVDHDKAYRERKRWLERRDTKRKRERQEVAKMRKRLKRKADAANAGAAGDADKATRLRTGKSKALRARASRKAAKTRKRKKREFARRSKAAKKGAVKAAATRRRKAEQHARRSAAAKRGHRVRELRKMLAARFCSVPREELERELRELTGEPNPTGDEE